MSKGSSLCRWNTIGAGVLVAIHCKQEPGHGYYSPESSPDQQTESKERIGEKIRIMYKIEKKGGWQYKTVDKKFPLPLNTFKSFETPIYP